MVLNSGMDQIEIIYYLFYETKYYFNHRKVMLGLLYLSKLIENMRQVEDKEEINKINVDSTKINQDIFEEDDDGNVYINLMFSSSNIDIEIIILKK